MKKILLVFTASLALAACTKTQFSPETHSTGSADFTTYIAVGNSLTQGYMDAGLYAYGQSRSYPSIIAAQAGANFVQPMVTGNGSGYMHLVDVNGQLEPISAGDSSYGPAIQPDPSWNSWGASYQSQQMNNMGVAGITLANTVGLSPTEKSINSVFCSYNPYGRFLNFGSLFSPIQYIDYIRLSKATFFTCWLGNNDVLGYATNGGKVQYVNVGFGNIPLNAITSPDTFAIKYDSILTVFHNLGAKGVCATIPDVTSIPYFNTVPSYVTVNGNPQYIYIQTKSGVRLATDQDHILLPAYASVLGGMGLSMATAVPDSLVLDVSETDSVQRIIIQYNNSIKSEAASFGFAVADMYQYLSTLEKSVYIDGISFNRQFISGGAFGLDGVHPNARGYALVANQFIQTINAYYGASIPPADVTKYKGVIFP